MLPVILPGIMNESIDSISQLISEEDDSKTKAKGSRGSNFTTEETEKLKKLVLEYEDIIKTQLNDKATQIKKDKAWDEIYKKLNVTAKHEHKFKLRWRRSNLTFKLGSNWV